MAKTSSFSQALAERIASALPTLDLKPRWIDSIRDLPATMGENNIFLINAAERAEQPRLLNSDQQIIVSNINILIVLSKGPRPSNLESENINKLKNSIRKALQGWIPPAQKEQQFFPCTLLAGAPLATTLSIQDGKSLWLETIQCKHIATKDTNPAATTSSNS